MANSDWSGLQTDLLLDILEGLELPELATSAATCSSWRSAASTLPLPPPGGPTPWLFFPGRDDGCNPNTAKLYSLFDNQFYKITLPDPPIRKRICVGSSNGWVATVDDRAELHLLNPFTRQQIPLPPLRTFKHVKTRRILRTNKLKYHVYDLSAKTKNNPPNIHTPAELQEFFYNKVLVFFNPKPGLDFVVVVLHLPYQQLSFARAGDKRWTTLSYENFYFDCVFHNGLLYALTLRGVLEIWNLDGHSPTSKSMEFNATPYLAGEYDKYLVQAPWGDLLQVWRKRNDIEDDPDCKTLLFEVKRVDLNAERLDEIKCLGEHALFIGLNNAVCVPTKNFPKLKSNCVYFTDDNWEWMLCSQNDPRDIGIYCLEDGTIEEMAGVNLQRQWPCPLWIVPNCLTEATKGNFSKTTEPGR